MRRLYPVGRIFEPILKESQYRARWSERVDVHREHLTVGYYRETGFRLAYVRRVNNLTVNYYIFFMPYFYTSKSVIPAMIAKNAPREDNAIVVSFNGCLKA